MNTEKNIKTIQQMYADFGGGNISGILDVVADNATWIQLGYPDLPFGSNGMTKKEIPGFFKKLADSVDYTNFEPREFIAEGNKVIVIGYHEGKTKPKGVQFGHEWIMVWKFNEEGKVTYSKVFTDTNELAKGFRN